MKIIVQPQKGDLYKLLFYDDRHVRGAGFVELTDTPKGPRPVKYRLRWGGKKEYKPPKEFREDIMDSLKEEKPQKYKDDIEEYYRKLLR